MASLQTDNPQLSTLLITWNLMLVQQQLLGAEGKRGRWVRKSYVLLMGQSKVLNFKFKAAQCHIHRQPHYVCNQGTIISELQ